MGKIGQKGNPGQTRFGQKTEFSMEKWLDGNFETSKYRPNYTQAKKQVGALLKMADASRRELEENLSKISSKREDVKKNYNIYRSAVEQTIMHIEDTLSQMEALKGRFFAAHPGQKAEYEKRLSVFRNRLMELEQDAKWIPRQLQGHRFKRIDNVINAEIALLSPKGAVPKKSNREQMSELKKIDTMVFTESEVAELEKREEIEKNAPKNKSAHNMVFTKKEAEDFAASAEQEEMSRRAKRMLKKQVSGLTSEIAALKEQRKNTEDEAERGKLAKKIYKLRQLRDALTPSKGA